MNNNLVIAIDGPAASGKGTIAGSLSQQYNFLHFQSSILYRNLARLCLMGEINLESEEQILKLLKSTPVEDLLTATKSDEKLGNASSKIAVFQEVRGRLNNILKNVINQNSRIIMEGRDIGTIVAPDADLKLFITASVDVRARRRYEQLINSGSEAHYEAILNYLLERDERDQNREVGPLVAAKDALIIDSSTMTLAETIQTILSYCKKRNIPL